MEAKVPYRSADGLSLGEIGRILKAEVLSGEHLLDRRVVSMTSTELMSQVLAAGRPGTLLLTRLSNIQVVHTAEVAALGGVVFIHGARPPEAVIHRAKFMAVPTLLTAYSSEDACSLLLEWGLRLC